MILGIDPGTKGGLAVLNAAGRPLLLFDLEGCTVHEAEQAVREASRLAWYSACYLEKVGHITGDGGQGSFTFGKVYGVLYGAALAHDLDVVDVFPQRWQEAMRCPTGGVKKISRMRARELWPALSKIITDNTADALLIAEYGRRRILGIH